MPNYLFPVFINTLPRDIPLDADGTTNVRPGFFWRELNPCEENQVINTKKNKNCQPSR